MFLFPGLKRDLGPRAEISNDSYVMCVTLRMTLLAVAAASIQLAANLAMVVG